MFCNCCVSWYVKKQLHACNSRKLQTRNLNVLYQHHCSDTSLFKMIGTFNGCQFQPPILKSEKKIMPSSNVSQKMTPQQIIMCLVLLRQR